MPYVLNLIYLALLATLSPEQRAKFITLMRERRAAARRAQSR